ncbi:MAG: glycerate kinase [Thiohalomonadales bacterium]
MKIIVSPNALKGCLSARSAAIAMQIGIERAKNNVNIHLKPVADGGDGFAEILADAQGLHKKNISVCGPLEESISTVIYFSENKSVSVIETATIVGLSLVPAEKRNPLLTTTSGIGQAIRIALDEGAKHIILGLGGSATNDAGMGMATALGVRFLDKNDKPVKPVGASLLDVSAIDTCNIDYRLADVRIDVAGDVQNFLYGEKGAAYGFAQQKGATTEQVRFLDEGLRQFSKVLSESSPRDNCDFPGAGAAGGLAVALKVFCGANIYRGIDIVLEAIDFNSALKNADLVLTTEGQLDAQTNAGKAPAGVAERAYLNNIPCIVIAGSVPVDFETIGQSNFSAALSLCPGPISLTDSIKNAYDYLSYTTEQVVRIFIAGRKF